MDISKWNIDRLKIKQAETPGGKKFFKVEGYLPNGQQVRKRFTTEQEAKRKRWGYVRDVEDAAAGGEYRHTQLSREDERDAEVALKSLRQLEGEYTLSGAVEFFKTNHKDKTWTDKTIAEAVELYADDCKNRGLSLSTLNGYRQRLCRMSESWGERMVADITHDEVKEWIYCRKPDGIGPWDKKARKLVTNSERNNEKRVLSAFFSFCVDSKWCESSPVLKVKTATVPAKDPKAYNPEDVAKIMAAAVRYEKLCPEDESRSHPPHWDSLQG